MEAATSTETPLNHASPSSVSTAQLDEYVRLQRRIYLATLLVTVFAFAITLIFYDLHASISLLIGAISGLFYMRLLARSVGKLGKDVKAVGKIQLVVPVLLVLAVSRLPQLELIPSLVGFLLYKPALILQAMLES